MGEYYEEVYLKRLNRYGIDFQSRLQRQREENFHRQLLKSVYYVNFDYEDKQYEGEFTPCKQNETKTIHYLLTDVNLNIPNWTKRALDGLLFGRLCCKRL